MSQKAGRLPSSRHERRVNCLLNVVTLSLRLAERFSPFYLLFLNTVMLNGLSSKCSGGKLGWWTGDVSMNGLKSLTITQIQETEWKEEEA